MSKSSTSRKRIYALGMSSVVVMGAVALLVLAPAHSRPSSALSGFLPASQAKSVSADARGRLQASFAALPLAFEQNQGQTDPQVRYMARASGYTFFLTNDDAVFSFHSKSTNAELPTRGRALDARTRNRPKPEPESVAVVHMQLAGGNTAAAVTPADLLPGKSSYYLGNDPRKWHAGVPQYGRVSYKNVYPGIDLAYYGQQSKLEFDFIVAPHSDPTPIHLAFSGAQNIATDDSGNLLVASSAGNVVLHKPVAYQQENGIRHIVNARFVLQANNVSFELGSYDRSRELVIDPSVAYAYATYLGGSAEDDGNAIAIDSSGNVYVTGQTASTNFPKITGGYSGSNAGGFDAFVTKISADGSALLYSTYVGGSGNDSGNAIAIDASGDAFVAGGTGSSADFPTTAGAFQTAFGGGLVDAFIFELSPNGSSLTYSTYLGGAGDDVAEGIAVDASGNTYIAGSTTSIHFPTHNPIQGTIVGASNGFVTKLNSSGNALTYSTYLGGGTGDIAVAVAVDTSGNAYVTGATQNPTFPTTTGAFQTTCGSDGTCNGGLYDAFVSVIKADGSGFVYSTFLGGELQDEGFGIAVDSTGDAFITGLTASSAHFPLKSALQGTFGGGTVDAFVTEFNPTGSTLMYSTYLGGSGDDTATGLALDGSGNVYVTGQTGSTNFPLAGATQSAPGGQNDAFVSEVSPSGSQLLFSTYLGGSLNENTSASGGGGAIGAIAVNSAGTSIAVTGNTTSTDFPTHAPAYQSSNAGGTDAFVVKYSQVTTPDFTITANPNPLSAVSQAGSTTSTITIAALNGFTDTVNFTCSVASVSGGTPLPTCAIPNPVTGGAGTSTLTVNTTGAAAAIVRPSKFFYAMWLPIAGLSLVGMSFSSARSRRKKLLGFMMVLMIMAALFLMPACGGSSTHTTPPPPCSGCTPTGNYTVTVTGTDSSNANLTHSVTPALTLTVN